MSFLRRTNTGRVVYQRARNFFQYRAVARILRTMIADENQIHPEDSLAVLSVAVQNLVERTWDLTYDKLLKLADVADDTGATSTILHLVHLWIRMDRLRREMGIRGGLVSPRQSGKFGLPFNPFKPPPYVEVGSSWTGDWYTPLMEAGEAILAYKEEIENGKGE